MDKRIDRRRFLEISVTGSGGLLIGFSLWGCKSADKAEPGAAKTAEPTARQDQPLPGEPKPPVKSTDLSAWVRIDSDNTIHFIVPEAEMGQGVLTSLAMILAEELDADCTLVRVEQAPANQAAFGRQSTGGSTSIRKGFTKVRTVGAQARAMLVAAAAKQWNVPAEECTTEKSAVVHQASGKRAGYGEL
ncbi:MAG: molybdopterin cofactor-binding domain-containing protein, partial [Myxococcota bacterium]